MQEGDVAEPKSQDALGFRELPPSVRRQAQPGQQESHGRPAKRDSR